MKESGHLCGVIRHLFFLLQLNAEIHVTNITKDMHWKSFEHFHTFGRAWTGVSPRELMLGCICLSSGVDSLRDSIHEDHLKLQGKAFTVCVKLGLVLCCGS